MTKGVQHLLDCDRIEEFDEINGDDQLVWVWCNTHARLEWHSIDLDKLDEGGLLTTSKREVNW